MNCSRGELVLLPIPFTDLSSAKVRPAVVVGKGSHPGDVFVVPVTSQLQNGDLSLVHWQAEGLNVPSAIKGQICTIEDRLIRRIIGSLTQFDQAALDAKLRAWLSL